MKLQLYLILIFAMNAGCKTTDSLVLEQEAAPSDSAEPSQGPADDLISQRFQVINVEGKPMVAHTTCENGSCSTATVHFKNFVSEVTRPFLGDLRLEATISSELREKKLIWNSLTRDLSSDNPQRMELIETELAEISRLEDELTYTRFANNFARDLLEHFQRGEIDLVVEAGDTQILLPIATEAFATAGAFEAMTKQSQLQSDIYAKAASSYENLLYLSYEKTLAELETHLEAVRTQIESRMAALQLKFDSIEASLTKELQEKAAAAIAAETARWQTIVSQLQDRAHGMRQEELALQAEVNRRQRMYEEIRRLNNQIASMRQDFANRFDSLHRDHHNIMDSMRRQHQRQSEEHRRLQDQIARSKPIVHVHQSVQQSVTLPSTGRTTGGTTVRQSASTNVSTHDNTVRVSQRVHQEVVQRQQTRTVPTQVVVPQRKPCIVPVRPTRCSSQRTSYRRFQPFGGLFRGRR